MLNQTSRQPRVHWRLLGVAVLALALTVIVGILEIIPDESPKPTAPFTLGVIVSGVIMIAALVVFVGCIMLVLGEFLRSEEYAERAYARTGQRDMSPRGAGDYAAGAGMAGAGPFVVSARTPEAAGEGEREREPA